MTCSQLFKILIIGDPDAGKTSILARFSEDAFSDIPTDTIGGVQPHITDLTFIFIERFYITFSADPRIKQTKKAESST